MNRIKNNLPAYFWIPVLSVFFWSCQEEKKAEPVRIAAIRDGAVVMSDSSKVAIPHYGDTAYAVFYCVRHAEKKKNAGDNPGLTPEGETRAKRLGKIMSGVKLDLACSTNLKRAALTAELARKEMPKPPPAETYPPDFQDVWLEEKLKVSAGKHYLIAGHSNTIPKLLNSLKGNPVFQDIPDDEFDRFYIAVTKGVGQTEVLELRY